MLQFLGASVPSSPLATQECIISVHHGALTRCLGVNAEPPVHQPPPIACFHRNTERASDA